MRIALCGYAEEFEGILPGWTREHWTAGKSYGQANGHGNNEKNRHSETVLFSPHCLSVGTMDMFAEPDNLLTPRPESVYL